MTVSSRFRDIFSSGRITIRRDDAKKETVGPAALSDAEFGKRAGEVQVDLIWLEIAHAHRKAARAFTPEFIRIDQLASSDA